MKDKVEDLLLKKYGQITAGAKLLMAITDDWQVINHYLSNRISDIALNEEQENKLCRYQFIVNQLLSGKYEPVEVLNMVQKLYGVSIRQVYNDISSACMLFQLVRVNKLFEIQMQLESAIRMREQCINDNDIETALFIHKNIIALIGMLPGESETPATHFEALHIEAIFDPGLLGAPDIDMNEVYALINEKRKVKIKMDLF